jgi:hypothetical protein
VAEGYPHLAQQRMGALIPFSAVTIKTKGLNRLAVKDDMSVAMSKTTSQFQHIRSKNQQPSL